MYKNTKPLADRETQTYYDQLILRSNSPVSVRLIDENKGKGLFCLQSFKKDQVILTEKPYVALQEVHNRASAPVCSHCFRFIGSLEEQLQRHEQMLNEMEEEEEDVMITESNVQHGTIGQLPQGNAVKTHVHSVECLYGCGERYCSEECRAQAYARYHRLLCVGQIEDESHPLFLFKVHATMNNELFLMAAQFIVVIITEWENNGHNIQKAMQPFNNLYKRYYWDAIDMNINEDVSKESLQKMLGESLQYLSNALIPYIKQLEGGEILASYLFNFNFYALLLGVLENNNQSIEITSPLQIYLQKLSAMPDIDKKKAWNQIGAIANRLIQLQTQEDHHHEEDNMEDEDEIHHSHSEENIPKEISLEDALSHQPFVFPPLQGLGLFLLESTTNHSCIPNCIVKYENDNCMKLIALRDIEEGEELTHSYIEESAPLEERQEQLKSYDFVCNCPKCISESNARIYHE
jgi:hypothetical protein